MHTYELYPKIEPFAQYHIPVGDGHELHVREYGTKGATPVVVNHGGPGAGCSAFYAQFFDSKKFHIIMYDQRGAGLSTPKFSLHENTTDKLIEDLEKIRRALGLKQFLLFGGSWGATLSILYAQKYPKRTLGLILRGIFIGREKDISAFLHDGSAAANKHPDEWCEFKKLVFGDPNKKCDFKTFIDALYEKISNEDPNVWQPLAYALAAWEGLNACEDPVALAEELEWCKSPNGLGMGRIEPHFMAHDIWLKEDQIVNDAHKIAHLPIDVVQGQKDKITPKEQAELFIEALEKAGATSKTLTVHRTPAGHSADEPENISALIEATINFANKVARGEIVVKPSGVAKLNNWSKPPASEDSAVVPQAEASQEKQELKM